MCTTMNGKTISLNEGCLGFNHKVMIRESHDLVIMVTKKSMVCESLGMRTSFARGRCITYGALYLR